MCYIKFYLFQVGLKYRESVVIRITGCPNGCARPYMAELGLVGDGPNSYQVLLAQLCFRIFVFCLNINYCVIGAHLLYLFC